MMGLELAWMRPDAPYMPIAVAGLLAVLEDAGLAGQVFWNDSLIVDTDAPVDEVARAIDAAPLPDVDAIAWPLARAQAVKSSLGASDDPLGVYRALIASVDGVEHRLLLSLATDQVDDGGSPARTRLLRGAKSDLSAFRDTFRRTVEGLHEELRFGPQLRDGKSGRALGLVPEVQTFGGTVGRDASTVNAESPLLSLLLRHGIMALPPVGVAHRGRRVVGGPLIGDDGSLSWPRWQVPCGLRDLLTLFTASSIHSSDPDRAFLRARGIDAVYRSRPQQLSTTVAVYRWGTRVA